MSERAAVSDDATMKFGLLLESAETHQRLADAHLQKLQAHTQDLDEVVRGEIRRTLIEELQSLSAESERAAHALRGMRRAASWRGVLWTLGCALLCAVALGAAARWVLPSAADIRALRGERDVLAQNVARLEQRGGKADWRACGERRRLCVRIDRQAPSYGETADYYVVKGY